VSKVDPDAMGLNPAWRSAFVHAVVGEGWEDGASSEQINAGRVNLRQRLAKLTTLAPNLGCYFNEVRSDLYITCWSLEPENMTTIKAFAYELNPRETFFGSHYEWLKAIKKKYDPNDLFLVVEGVGSDEWDEDLRCRKP
jgi:hypothetical protein